MFWERKKFLKDPQSFTNSLNTVVNLSTKPCVLFCVYHTESEQIEMNLKMMEGKYAGGVVESH